MSANPKPKGNAPSPRSRRLKWFGGVATAVLIAVFAGLASGLGEKAVDAIATDEALISYGIEEQPEGECGGASYQPEPQATRTLGENPPYEADEWTAFHAQPSAAPAGSSLVQVSIQGESARTITLTDIRFDVTRGHRRSGSTFAAACGDPLVGRGVAVDLEARPPRVIASSENPKGYVETGGEPGSRTKPIVFPWTVSISDPLLLYIVANATLCDCRWIAEIPWVSGSRKGIIRIDDEGEPFHVVGTEGLPHYASSGKTWRKLP